MHWIYLCTAIAAEVVGSTALKASDGFSKPGPAILALGGFAIALYFLSLSLRTLPLGVAYAIWAGAGTALIAGAGAVLFRQSLDTAGYVGIAFIIAGVIVLNTLSKTVTH